MNTYLKTERNRRWWIKNRDRVNAERRAARKANPEYYNAQQRAWCAKHRTKLAEDKRKQNLQKWLDMAGWSVERYDDEKLRGCRICGRKDTLVFDHDHNTSKVRGLLCRNCNANLGWFEPKVQEIVSYLNESR